MECPGSAATALLKGILTQFSAVGPLPRAPLCKCTETNRGEQTTEPQWSARPSNPSAAIQGVGGTVARLANGTCGGDRVPEREVTARIVSLSSRSSAVARSWRSFISTIRRSAGGSHRDTAWLCGHARADRGQRSPHHHLPLRSRCCRASRWRRANSLVHGSSRSRYRSSIPGQPRRSVLTYEAAGEATKVTNEIVNAAGQSNQVGLWPVHQ